MGCLLFFVYPKAEKRPISFLCHNLEEVAPGDPFPDVSFLHFIFCFQHFPTSLFSGHTARIYQLSHKKIEKT